MATELRSRAFELAKHKRKSDGGVQKIAYQQKKDEEMRRLELIPEHEKEYEASLRNKDLQTLKDKIADYLTENHSTELKGSMFDINVRSNLQPIILSYIRREKAIIVGFDSDEELAEYMLNEIAGLGPIDELIFKVPGISEIWVNGENPITKEVDVYYEKKGKKFKETTISFRDKEHAYEIANKIARNGSQSFGSSMPMANVRYPDGRVNLVRGPIATGDGGPYISFRLFPKDTFLPEDLLRYGSISEDMYVMIKAAFKYGLNILFVGPTGSGKTTLMTACCSFIPDDQRILLMEDTEEMRLRHKFPNKHIITEECKFNTQDEHRHFDLSRLTTNALRQKPDYMLYGEVRDKAAYDMLNGANTGHIVTSTLHARSAPRAVQRLINMVLEHGSKMSTDAIGKWVAESIDIIIFQKLYKDNKRRVKEIIELQDYKNGEPIYNTLFKFVVEGKNEDGTLKGNHYKTGIISEELVDHMIDGGIEKEELAQLLKKPDGIEQTELYCAVEGGGEDCFE